MILCLFALFIKKLISRKLKLCKHSQKGVFPDLLATSGDYLRVWRAGEPETRLECVLNNVRVSVVANHLSVLVNIKASRTMLSMYCKIVWFALIGAKFVLPLPHGVSHIHKNFLLTSSRHFSLLFLITKVLIITLVIDSLTSVS